MSDSDSEELAQLRRQRAQQLGNAGLTVTSLRKQNEDKLQASRRNQHNKEHDNEEHRPVVIETTNNNHIESDDEEIPAELRAHFPTSFGAPPRKPRNEPVITPLSHQKNLDSTYDDEENNDIGPTLPKSKNTHLQTSNDTTDSSDQEDTIINQTNPWNLPISSEAILDPHSKAVVALALDHSGSRLVTGSTDYTVKIFDFTGMKSDCKPFRSFEPTEGHPVIALSWSPSSESFLVVTGSPQPKVYSRDGQEQGEFPRGDMYIRDMKNTKGHISACTGGAWHPHEKTTGITSSEDGTLRVWDLETCQQKTVIKPTLSKPGRVSVTACAYTSDGRSIGGGLFDGTIQLWDVRGKFGSSAAVGMVPLPKAQMVTKQDWTYVTSSSSSSKAGSNKLLRNAHQPQTEITCLAFTRSDSMSLISRGADGTLKIWDLRSFKKPVAVVNDVPAGFDTTQCCFSPDEKLVLTGVGAEHKNESGYLGIYKKDDASLVQKLGMPGNCVAVQWHPKINQILVGCGDRKQGTARVLYDPLLSSRGALLSIGRRPRIETTADFTTNITPIIYNPNALPLYREDMPSRGGGGGGGKRKAQVDLSIRTSKSYKPEVGTAGSMKGAHGNLGTSGGSLLTQYLLKTQGQLKKPVDEDVRAAILRHAGKEDEFSKYAEVYAKTQPEKIFAIEEKDEDEDGDGGV